MVVLEAHQECPSHMESCHLVSFASGDCRADCPACYLATFSAARQSSRSMHDPSNTLFVKHWLLAHRRCSHYPIVCL
jgi:hypothetical protein